MRTDTKSYDDFVKITHHLSSHSGAECVVDIFCGDGQSVLSFKNLKKRFPYRCACLHGVHTLALIDVINHMFCLQIRTMAHCSGGLP